jgi:Trp operon repressor
MSFDVLTLEELTEELADATGASVEEIERGAAELEIAPPEEADIVAYGEHDGEHGFLPEPDDE